MLDGMSGVTGHLLELALDAAALRHQAIANNVANIGSRGYVPEQVNFEAQLEAVLDVDSSDMTDVDVAARLGSVRPFIEEVDVPPGGGSTLTAVSEQMALLSKNTVQYQVLLKALEGRMNLLEIAVNEGRR